MNKATRKNKNAFTLIELLVVIAIIGLLSTISIVALNQARSKARDARRVADMHQLANAINMYYSQYGEYPTADNLTTGLDRSSNNNFLSPLIDAGYISTDFKDPLNNKDFFYYYWINADYSAFHSSFCPEASAKTVLRFSLENNTALPGFATICATNNETQGWARCICFY